MEFIYLLKSLLRKKWLILSCTLIAIVAAHFFTIRQKPVYKSSTQIATGFTASEKMKISDENFNLSQIDTKFDNVIENFSSPRVLQLLSYNLILHDLTEKSPFKRLDKESQESDKFKAVNISNAINIFKDKLNSMSSLDPESSDDLKLLKFLKLYGYDDGSLADLISVYRLSKTDYLNIEFTSSNADLSAFMCNTIVKELNRYYSQTKVSSATSSAATLDSVVNAKKTILDQKLAAKSAYYSSHGIVDVGVESGNKLSQIATFENQLAEEKGKVKNLTYRVAELARLISEAKTKGVTSAVNVAKPANSENGEYLKLKKQHADLYSQYAQKGFNDPELKRKLDAVSEEMKALNLNNSSTNPLTTEGTAISVDELVQKKLDSEGELRAANEKIAVLQNGINQMNGNLTGMASSGAEIQKLNTEVEIAQTEYTAAKDKLNTVLNIAEGYNTSFKQNIIAQPALAPEPSKRLIIVALAGLAVFFLSSLIIILLEYFDPSIKTPSQFYRLTHLPLLGTVNYISKFDNNVMHLVTDLDNEEKNRQNTFRELLRKLRYEVENSNKKIFLFTSTEPNQGKTTIIQALAHSLSLSKKKVLIIDTNFCNNDLTVLLNANPVLEKFQINGKPFSVEDTKALIKKTSIENVDTIGCGSGDYTPSEILPKNHLLNYLPQLLTVYDFIFLEGAPLNNYTDTKELIHYSDAMIAVFASDTTLTATDKESINFLRQNKEKFVGAILNRVQVENINM